ncbi:hypothetical protein [Celeribacter halophilus]|nr:hypothetical protein [Celeribacter halophilus]
MRQAYVEMTLLASPNCAAMWRAIKEAAVGEGDGDFTEAPVDFD